MLLRYGHKTIIASSIFVIGLIVLVYFFWTLTPVRGEEIVMRPFVVERGERFIAIAARLEREGFIRSGESFTIFALVRGAARKLMPGNYEFAPAMSAGEILWVLVRGRMEVTVTIPEGATVFAVDTLLSAKDVVPSGSIVALARARMLEGRLFPDTYRFFTDAPPEEVIAVLLNNFDAKALPLLKKDPPRLEENLILASLLEREVPDFKERQIVSGILTKRLRVGMALQVDATICYSKEERASRPDVCHPLRELDYTIDSPYNTYIYRGLPPGPIGNPGISAIEAAIRPIDSPYWFYLSDPETGRTIFSETLDEHRRNRVKYLAR